MRFAPRNCNKLAHELAASGATQDDDRVVWPYYVPESVNSVLASELAAPNSWNHGVPSQKKNLKSLLLSHMTSLVHR